MRIFPVFEKKDQLPANREMKKFVFLIFYVFFFVFSLAKCRILKNYGTFRQILKFF